MIYLFGDTKDDFYFLWLRYQYGINIFWYVLQLIVMLFVLLWIYPNWGMSLNRCILTRLIRRLIAVIFILACPIPQKKRQNLPQISYLRIYYIFRKLTWPNTTHCEFSTCSQNYERRWYYGNMLRPQLLWPFFPILSTITRKGNNVLV